MSRKIYVEAYGCTQEKSETGLYANSIMSDGDTLTENPEEADIRIIGTCVVIGKTEKKMIHRISELADFGSTKVMGCLPPISSGTLAEKNIDLISASEFRNFYRGSLDDIEIREPSILDGIPINQGCTGNCNFCISRVARGKLLSRTPEKIVNQIGMVIGRGLKEIRISSLDTAAYGKDIGVRLPDLVNSIVQLEHDFSLRVGMMEPKNTDEIIEPLLKSYESEKVFRFMHLPVQDGDDRILELMNREYKVKSYYNVSEKFRKKFPDSLFSTDIIVGYPDSDQTSFENTVELLYKSRPDIVNITTFSPRQFTKDFHKKLPPSNLVKKWSYEYSRVHKEIIKNNFSKHIGEIRKVLITENGKGDSMVGRDSAYRPVVMRGKQNLYERIECEIVDVGPTYLVGKAITA